MLTESDVWKSNGIMAANFKAALDMLTLMELVRAVEAEVRAEVQEPVYAYRRKGMEYFVTCDEDRYNELAQKPNLFEMTTFYTAPQPPAQGNFDDWSKNHYTIVLQKSIAEDYGPKRPYNGRAMSVQEHDEIVEVLQAKVVEQAGEIERLTSELNVSLAQARYLMKDQEVKFARIEELESNLVAMTECAKNHDEARSKYFIELGEVDTLIEKCEKAMRSNNYDRMSETLVAIAERKKV